MKHYKSAEDVLQDLNWWAESDVKAAEGFPKKIITELCEDAKTLIEGLQDEIEDLKGCIRNISEKGSGS